MQKIKFDFEATKERIYAPNSNVPIGAPVDRNGNIANDGNAYGIVLCKETENEKYWVRYNLVVMVAGYCDIIDAQEIWGDEYSAEAIAAMSDIIFCDDHKIGGGGGWPADLPKPSVGGYGYTEQGEQTTITWDGDTEGRDIILNTFYKVSDLTPPEYAISNGTFLYSDEETSYPVGHGEELGDIVMFYANKTIIVATSSGQIVTKDGTVYIPSAGLYFAKKDDWFTTSLTYGTPDTVHKIDEKYLPEAGGGAMVATFTITEYGTTVATHTVEKVSSAMKSGIVYAVLQLVRDGETVFICSGVMEPLLFDYRDEPVYDEGSPCLVGKSVVDGATVDWIIKIAVSNGEWVAYER